MSRDDWRDPGAYEWTLTLDAFGFAWEFLRRNPEFVKELRFLKRVHRKRPLTQIELELFALRWGVRFPWSERDSEGRGCTMDRACLAQRRCPHLCTRRHRRS